jgi:cell division protein FtsI (penicillin-binding protein 3)
MTTDGGRLSELALRRRADAVAWFTGAGLILVLTILLARVGQLQVSPSQSLVALVDDRVSRMPEPGVRGDLLDRRGRPLALSCFGYRAFVDPVTFVFKDVKRFTERREIGESLARLSDAIGIPVGEVAERIVPAIARNDALLADPEAPQDLRGRPVGLDRFVPIGGLLDDSRVELVRAAAIPGVHLELRAIRESPGDEFAASLIGLVGIEDRGLRGAEYYLNEEMQPRHGHLAYVRDARTRPLWIEPGGYEPAQRGADTRLTIDLELQRIATEELQRGVEEADAAGGRLVMMDPETGEILAMVDVIREVRGLSDYPWISPRERRGLPEGRRYRTILPDPDRAIHPSLGRNRCVEDVYEPGSTFKPFLWAVVTELGLAAPGEVIDTESGHWTAYSNRHIEDVVKREHMTWSEVLVNSSNIGMGKVTSRMSPAQMRAAVVRFGFGTSTRIGLPGESPGLVTTLKRWGRPTQVSVAMGHEVAVTPVQMVRAFCALARTGDKAGTLPVAQLAETGREEPGVEPRVLPARIAELTRRTMRGITQKIDTRLMAEEHAADGDGSSEKAGPKYEWFGKSGTAEIPLGKAPKGKRRPQGAKGYYPDQYNSSFIAGAPLNDPRVVIVVVIDDPGPERVRAKTHYGSHVAGPVARRVIERGLTYLGVAPPPREPASQTAAR